MAARNKLITFLSFIMLLVSCESETTYEKYSSSETYTLTLYNSLDDLTGILDGLHQANLTVQPNSTPPDKSANFIETNCNYNHFLTDHHLATAVYGIVGEFNSFSYLNKLVFSFPLKLTYDFTFPNSEKNYFYSDYRLFRIPINPNHSHLIDSMLDEASWEELPITWSDTTIEDYGNPIVTCESYISEINSLYTIGRLTKN